MPIAKKVTAMAVSKNASAGVGIDRPGGSLGIDSQDRGLNAVLERDSRVAGEDGKTQDDHLTDAENKSLHRPDNTADVKSAEPMAYQAMAVCKNDSAGDGVDRPGDSLGIDGQNRGFSDTLPLSQFFIANGSQTPYCIESDLYPHMVSRLSILRSSDTIFSRFYHDSTHLEQVAYF